MAPQTCLRVLHFVEKTASANTLSLPVGRDIGRVSSFSRQVSLPLADDGHEQDYATTETAAIRETGQEDSSGKPAPVPD